MQEKIDILSEKLERESYVGDKQNIDFIDFETTGKNSKVKCKLQYNNLHSEVIIILYLLSWWLPPQPYTNIFVVFLIWTVSQSNSQKVKTSHKLKVQTSKIVSSFKAPTYNCQLIREFTGHKDGIWDLCTARPGQALIGTASAGKFYW